MRDVVRCHVDLLYLKGTLRLPPEPVAEIPEHLLERMPRPGPSDEPVPGRVPSLVARAAGTLLALLRRHLDRHATDAALAGRRSLRRIGG